MEITTKLAPGEKGFVLHENKIYECEVMHICINCRKGKKGTDLTGNQFGSVPEIKYTLFLEIPKGDDTDESIYNIEEKRVFRTKDELLKSL